MELREPGESVEEAVFSLRVELFELHRAVHAALPWWVPRRVRRWFARRWGIDDMT